MKGDKIFCLNPFCKQQSIDNTLLYDDTLIIQDKRKQDSRYKFKNDCPYCKGTNTLNLKRKPLNTLTNNERLERLKKHKRIDCWICKLNGTKILDKYGCCIRCGTNLKKYPMMRNIPYPKIDSETISARILGIRKQFDFSSKITIPKDMTICNLNSAKKELGYADEDELQRLEFRFSLTEGTIPMRYLINYDIHMPKIVCKEKILKEIYKSWRYGYDR